jgi:hypothetical protein
MPTRRSLLTASLLPLGLAACGGTPEPAALPPLVTGYRHLTPLRLNVQDIEVAEPAPGVVQLSSPPPALRPDVEMRRMADERLVPVGTEGQGRFIISQARFTRERLSGGGGLGSLFAGEPGERLTCNLVCRLEILSPEGRRVAFVEAEARRSRTLPDGATPGARARAAEDVVRDAMEQLNVEFEFQVRRTLRGWLQEAVTTPAAPAPEAVEREDLSATQRR